MSDQRAEPMEVVIRPMLESDISSVVEIEKKGFSDPWPASAFSTLIKRDYVRARVAVDKHEVLVGYCIVIVAADVREVANICVDVAVRGRGVAGRLLDEAMAAADQDLATLSFLEVRVSNLSAIRLYESRGFSTVGRRKGYYQHPVEDALILRRGGAGGDA